MINRTLFLFLLPFLVICPEVSAQKLWTLEECIQYALDNNITIRRQELSNQISKNNYLQSKMEILPSLNAGADHNLGSGRILNTESYQWENNEITQGSAGIQADITLFNGLQTYNSIQQKKFDMLASLADNELARNDVILNIATAFMQILFDQELLEVSKSQLKVTQLQVEKMKKLVDVGNKALGDLLQIQAQAASEQVNVTNAENKLKISLLTLAQLLDLEKAEGFQIATPAELQVNMEVPMQPVDSIFAIAEQVLPDVKSASYLLKSNEQALQVAWGRLSPEVSLRGIMYSRYNDLTPNPRNPLDDYPYSLQFKDNVYKQVTLNVSIPLFNKWRVKTQIDNAKINVLDARDNLSLVKQNLYKTIQQAHADAVNAYDKYLSAIEAVKSNEEAFKYIEQKFGVGLVSSVEYNVERNNLTKARADLLQAKYEFIFKTKILDFYMGKPILI